MTEGEENIIIKGVLLEAISRDFSEELSNNKEVSVSPRFKRHMDWFSGMMENCLSTGPKKKELSVRQRLKLLIAWLTVTQRS